MMFSAAPLRHRLRRHVLPVSAAVPREVHEPIVGAGPDGVLLEPRRSDREDGAVEVGAAVIAGQRPAVVAFLGLVVARQIRADALETLPSIGRFEEHIPGRVQRTRVERRIMIGAVDWKRYFTSAAGRPPGVSATRRYSAIHRVDGHSASQPVVAAGVHDVRVAGGRRDIAALAATHAYNRSGRCRRRSCGWRSTRSSYPAERRRRDTETDRR